MHTATSLAGKRSATAKTRARWPSPILPFSCATARVLFGLVGLLMLVAAFRAALVPAAFIAGFVSVASFLWLAWSVGGYNPQIARVVVVDLVALACLVIGAVAHAYLKPVV